MNHNDNVNKNDFVGVIAKVVEYCNFSCQFCAYSKNKHKEKMDISIFKKLVYKAGQYNIEHGRNQLTVFFHGGEPLLWGIENFKKALEIEKIFESLHKDFHITNNIQTNGALLDEEWIDFFTINKFNVGVSLDGPPEINFHKNSNQDVVVNNIKKLISCGCNTRVLSVITDKHKDYADRYYDYMVKNGILNIGLCFCVDYNNNTHIDNAILTNFLKTLYNRCRKDKFILYVREFANIINCCKNKRSSSPRCCTFSSRKICGNYFSVTPTGDIVFCDSLGFKEQLLGNIMVDDFYNIKNEVSFKNKLNFLLGTSQEICENCEIREVCGRGCAKEITSSGESFFCETYKEIYKYILKDINKI